MDCTINVVKTKELINYAITVQLICTFVFAYAKIGFSHDAAQVSHFVTNLASVCSASSQDSDEHRHTLTLIRLCCMFKYHRHYYKLSNAAVFFRQVHFQQRSCLQMTMAVWET